VVVDPDCSRLEARADTHRVNRIAKNATTLTSTNGARRVDSGTPVAKHVVVGGGVVGLASAYYLRRDGTDVTVLERATIGSGASWGNAGWVDPTFSAPLTGPGMVATALVALTRPNGSFYLSLRHLPRGFDRPGAYERTPVHYWRAGPNPASLLKASLQHGGRFNRPKDRSI